jgi:myo-inositol-1(or 4)-monophosphatase
MENKSPELEVAIKAALEAGKIVQKYFETEVLKEYKEDTSIVTKADQESEEVIKKIILDNFPNHSILGEETGMTENKSDYIWYVDPVDGTRNFANGIPVYAVSICLAYKGDFLVGVIHNPSLNYLLYAEKDKGAYWNNTRIFVSKDDAKHAIVTVSSGRTEPNVTLKKNLLRYLPGGAVSTVRDFACTSMDLVFVAKGSTEADIKMDLTISQRSRW